MKYYRECLWQLWQLLFPFFLIFIVVWKGGKALDSVWLLAGMSACGALLAPVSAERQVSKSLWCATILFILWTALSFLFSQTANYGFDELLQTISLGLLFLLTLRGHISAGKCSKALSLATIIACGVGVLIYLGSPVTRFVGTFFDYRFHTDYWPNAWAEYLLLLWPVVAYSIFKDPKNKQHICSIILGFIFGCLLLSYSRGALLVLAVQIFIGAFFFLRQKSISFNTKSTSIALIVSTAILSFFAINHLRERNFSVQSVTEKITFTAAEGDSSKSERQQFWSGAWKLTKEEPLFGFGPYSFRFTYPKYQQGILATADHPHNVFLKLSSERGIPAAILLLALLTIVLVPFLRKYKTWTPLQFAFFLGTIGVIAHNLIDYNLQFVGIAVPFWLFLGFLGQKESLPEIASGFRWRTELILASILLIVAVYEVIPLIQSSIARHKEKAGNMRGALSAYEEVAWSFFPRDMELSVSQLASALGKKDSATDALQMYRNRNAIDGRAWLLGGTFAMEQGRSSESVIDLKKAYVSLKYNDPQVTNLLLNALEKERDTSGLGALLPEARILAESYAQAILENTHFIALSPNVERYLELLTTLSRLDPTKRAVYQEWQEKMQEHAMQERGQLLFRVE